MAASASSFPSKPRSSATTVNEKTLRALIEAGAVKRSRIVANGPSFHIEFDTPNGPVTASTYRKQVKEWASLDAAARWIKRLGLGSAEVELVHWTPRQKRLRL